MRLQHSFFWFFYIQHGPIVPDNFRV